MPAMIVWPVSGSVLTRNVGSSSISLLQGDAHLVLVLLGLRLDRDADDRLGEGDRLEHDRLRLVAQRVAGDRALRPDDGGDLAGLDLGDVLALVGVQLHQAAHPLALVARRVVARTSRS